MAFEAATPPPPSRILGIKRSHSSLRCVFPGNGVGATAAQGLAERYGRVGGWKERRGQGRRARRPGVRRVAPHPQQVIGQIVWSKRCFCLPRATSIWTCAALGMSSLTKEPSARSERFTILSFLPRSKSRALPAPRVFPGPGCTSGVAVKRSPQTPAEGGMLRRPGISRKHDFDCR